MCDRAGGARGVSGAYREMEYDRKCAHDRPNFWDEMED
jgi:hypothetical protein